MFWGNSRDWKIIIKLQEKKLEQWFVKIKNAHVRHYLLNY